jgi:hypothetical protein
MKRQTSIVLAFTATAALATALASNRVSEARSAAAAQQGTTQADEQPTLEALEWMSGSWQGSGLGGSVEEHWSRPAGKTLIGMFRLSQTDATSFTQFMLIETEQDGRILLRFKHFNAGYEPWEKEGPLTFVLTQARPGLAVFESPDPKQTPVRLSYSARGDNAMCAVIDSPEGGLGGPITFELVYKRGPATE